MCLISFGADLFVAQKLDPAPARTASGESNDGGEQEKKLYTISNGINVWNPICLTHIS